MTGLLKNNFYAAVSNIKVFAIVMTFSGAFVVAVDNDVQTLLISYMLLSIIGFSFSAVSCLQKENASKWAKYKLTAPVRRSDIVKSCYMIQILWLFAGIFFAAAGLCLSIFFHGFPFDRATDILLLFTVGIAVSLLMEAVFFPLFYFSGEEKSEVFLVVSLLCAIGLVMALVSVINWLFGPEMSDPVIMISAAVIICVSLLLFVLSYFFTLKIFRRKEY